SWLCFLHFRPYPEARHSSDHLDHDCIVVLAEAHVDTARIKFRAAMEHGRRHACAIGEITDQFEVMRDGDCGPHCRQKSLLRHHRRTDTELSRTSADGSQRLDTHSDTR